MVDFFVLLNDGTSFVLLNDGTSKVILNSLVVEEVVGGPSGGRSKGVGAKSLAQQQIEELGERPRAISQAFSTGRLHVRMEGRSKSKLQISFKSLSEAVVKPFKVAGISISQIQIPSQANSLAKLRMSLMNESMGFVYNVKKMNKYFQNMEKFQKVVKLMSLYQTAENLDSIYHTKKERTFSFDEITNDEQLKAFTHSSSFVGNVRYNPEEQSMRILLNGKAYSFCNVPERIYDAFEGANSKGAYFARNIKEQFNC